MNMHSNRRSTQHNFITIFKNLAVTKRQIMDLQKSISNVVQSMNKIDNYLAIQRDSSLLFQHRHPNILRNERNYGQLLRQINSHSESTDNSLNKTIKIGRLSYKPNPVHICSRCSKYFPNEDLLAVHIRNNHLFCRLCQSFYDQDKQAHIRSYCPQERVCCMGCSTKVKRRNLENHIQQCCYKICFKCKEAIYVKAYGYHMQQCKRSKKLITECKKLPTHRNAIQNKQQQRSCKTQRLPQRSSQPQVSLCSARMA